MKVAIVDYGMGNIRSIIGALKYIGVTDIAVTDDAVQLKQADKLILPGVGAFGAAIARIRERRLDDVLGQLVKKDKKPILGICLGMQLMASSSDENGYNAGLGFVEGDVRKFANMGLRVPHVGFNQVAVKPGLKLYQGFGMHSDFYFTHSYRMKSDGSINQCLCTYGEDFVASYEVGNVAGVQFHPELSQYNGLSLLNNFFKNF